MDIKILNIDELTPGVIIFEDIFDSLGNILVGSGITITENHIKNLKAKGVIQVKVVSNIVKKVVMDEYEPDLTVMNEERLTNLKFETISKMKSFYDSLSDINSPETNSILLVVEKMLEMILENKNVLNALMSLKESDEYDYSHGINVAIYSLMVGIQMGYNRATLTDLGIGALLHDIGKLALDQTIISKPSTLTYEEYEYVKRHSLEGFNMVKNLDLPNISKNIVLQHHENYDGSGYPLGVTNASLSPLVKIVSICDVYDAMTSDRVYMTKKDPYTSISTIISETNRKFDPVLVSNFIKTIGIYPIGMNLTLNTGEIGVVIEKRKHKPTVKVTIDRNGKLVDGYYVVELQNNPKIKVVKINIEEKSA